MCSCGGELTVWCYEHSDWACDDCGCPMCWNLFMAGRYDDESEDQNVSTTS